MVELLSNTLLKYFNILHKTGYRSYDMVDYIIILCFIEELSKKKYNIYMNYDDIHEILYLLSIINDRLCEYTSEEPISFKDFHNGHWLWDNNDLFILPIIYEKDKTICI